MSLTASQPMRRCGKRYGTEDEALCSKLGLTGAYGAEPCHCGGWHLRRVPLAAKTVKPAARKNTGPSRSVRALVAERDGHACVCCGRPTTGQRADIQHRDSRGMGGTSDPAANSPVNLILMLREHHRRVESRKFEEDNDRGYWLRMGEDPALTPVMYFEESGSGFTAWLCDDGSLSFDGPQVSAA